MPFSQTHAASRLAETASIIPTGCPPLDRILQGGLPRGYIVEISGPPGSLKEHLAIRVVKSFVERSLSVLFVDSQNATSPATLRKELKGKFPKCFATYILTYDS